MGFNHANPTPYKAPRLQNLISLAVQHIVKVKPGHTAFYFHVDIAKPSSICANNSHIWLRHHGRHFVKVGIRNRHGPVYFSIPVPVSYVIFKVIHNIPCTKTE